MLGLYVTQRLFLGANGFLNKIKHTSNGLDYLRKNAGPAYTGEGLYCHQPSVYEGNIVTASGAGFIDFSCNVMRVLNVADGKTISKVKEIFNSGFFPTIFDAGNK